MQGIEAYGMVESPIDHPRLLTSIEAADVILGPETKPKLVAGWKAVNSPSDVRAFAAVPEDLSDRELMSSYAECRCVIVKVGGVSAWLRSSMGSHTSLLDLDTSNLLVYMLLHETGHIVHGDSPDGEQGPHEVPSSTTTGLNLDPTAEKEREMSADRFAADAIRSAMSEKGTERAITASKVADTLSELSFNLAEHRLLDNFGGTETHDPALFWDAGLSHPNLEWRILSVNDAINRTDASHQLLVDFEPSRTAEPSVLYRASKP